MEIWPTGSDKPWVLPNCEIMIAAITGIARHQIQCDLVGGSSRNFVTRFARGCERGYRHLPCLRAITFADMTDRCENPQGLLPLANGREQWLQITILDS